MALKLDDLRRGMIVVITGRAEKPVALGEFPVFAAHRERECDGHPLKILEVSLPFVAVTDGQTIGAIDVRVVELGRVSNRYWNLVQKARMAPSTRSPSKRKKTKPERGYCTYCGEKLAQKCIERKWYYWCRECGQLGNPADST